MPDYNNQKIQLSVGHVVNGTVRNAIHVDDVEYKGIVKLQNRKTKAVVEVEVVGFPGNWWFTKTALRG